MGSSFDCCPLGNVDRGCIDVNLWLRSILGLLRSLHNGLWFIENIGEILRAMSPLILIALGFSVASKAGFFNVGLPGQALAGWTRLYGLHYHFQNYQK